MNTNLRIMLTGEIVAGGPIDWNIPPLPQERPVDGLTQEAIDAAHADVLAEEWQDYFLDEEFNRGGC
jgi:hypothetical protein